MSVESAITDIMSSDAGLTGLIGDNHWTNQIPEGEDLPAIAYSEVSGYTTGYTASGTTGLVRVRYQLTIQAESYTSVVDIRDAVITAFNAYTGTVAGVVIDHIEIVNSGDIANLSENNTLYAKFVGIVIYIL